MSKTKPAAKRSAVAPDPQLLFRGQKPSLWNFWRDGVTNSFLERFQECRRQTEIYYVEGWTPRNIPESIEQGQCGHWVNEQMYADDGNMGRAVVRKQAYRLHMQWLIKKYESLWLDEVPNATEYQLKQQEMVYAKVEAIMVNYFRRYEGDFTGKYNPKISATRPVKFVAAEGQFRVPYVFPDGKTTWLNGKRDLVFEDKRGDEWILDTKFMSNPNVETIVKTMPVNFQAMLYLHARTEENQLGDCPAPRGAILNVIARPQHKWNPEKESLREFVDRLTDALSDPEDWPKRYIRVEMGTRRSEIREWKATDLDPIMEDVRGWWEGRYPHYRSAKHVSNKYGLADVFPALVNNDYSTMYQRRKPFNELLEV